MTQETLKWKLFPYSLTGKAKQWYTSAVKSMNEDCDELIYKFCLAFFPMSRIVSLPRAILGFEQYKECIGAAWARFSALIHSGPDMFLPDSVLLRLFCSGLDMESNLCLDMTVGGRFAHKTMTEEVTFLKRLIDSHTSSVIKPNPSRQKYCQVLRSPHQPNPNPYLPYT